MTPIQLLFALAFLLPASAAISQTGRMAGTVTEAQTATPMPGVNVVIERTSRGASTDVDGYYVILNVPPGTYDVGASFIGFTSGVADDVRVSDDLTTTLDFELHEEAPGLEEMVITAERPVVQPDVSANVANLSMDDIEKIPVTNL